MNIRRVTPIFCLLVVAFPLSEIQAQSCGSYPSYQLDDHVAPLCDQGIRDHLWDKYRMWAGDGPPWLGHGDDRPCDLDWALARAFKGFYMVENSGDWDDFVVRHLPTFWRVDCSSDYAAWTRRSCFLFWCNSEVSFFQPFFYWGTPAYRAAVIIHEERHVDGVFHNADPNCPRQVSCDSHWGYNGANTYEVQGAADWVVRGTGGTEALRQRQVDYANWVLATGFRDPTGLKVDRYAGVVPSCYPSCGCTPHCYPGSCGGSDGCQGECWTCSGRCCDGYCLSPSEVCF